MAGFGALGLGQLGSDSEYANKQFADGAVGNFLTAYALDKSGLAGFMNSNAPKGYELSGGRLQKIPTTPAGSAVPASIVPTAQPDDGIDPRAKATLGMVEQHPDGVQISDNSQPMQPSPVPPPTDYSKEGGGILSSILKLMA
jgi:hypothetical protein